MNSMTQFASNTRSKLASAVATAVNKTNTGLAMLAVAVTPGLAMADDFDGATIVSKIEAYVLVGVAILTAFVIGRWTLKAFGVIGGR